MRYGLLRLSEIMPASHLDNGERSFVEYVADRKKNVMSNFDGGQMTFSFLIGQKTLLWNSHLGGYQGILQSLSPKPGECCSLSHHYCTMADLTDVLILSVAGRANIDGRPFDGSAAEAATKICRWLGEPKKVIFCLHDEAPIKPWRIDVRAAKTMIEMETRSRIAEYQPAEVYRLFEQ